MIAPAALAFTGPAATPRTFGPGVAEALSELGAGETLLLIATFEPGAARESLMARAGLTDAVHFESFPISYATGTAAAWSALGGKSGVVAIEMNDELEYHMSTAAESTRVRDVQSGAITSVGAIDGSGVGVAIVDSGVDCTHPDLAGACIPSRTLKNVPLTASYVALPNTDEHVGHGTHVAGIAVGDGTASAGLKAGVAPGARLYSYAQGAGLSILAPITAFNHILANPSAPGEPAIRVVSNSWGGTGSPAAADTTAVRALVAAGITVVFSAGNDGDAGLGLNRYCKITDTGGAPLAGLICVGSYTDGEIGTSEGAASFFSSRAIPGNPAGWLDISAPGDTIEAARATTGVAVMALSYNWGKTQFPEYVTIAGTSMAAPHVAGVIALIHSARAAASLPVLSPAGVNSLITGTAYAFGNWAPYPNIHAGYGLIDAQAAIETTLGLSVTPMPASQQVYSNQFGGIMFSGTGLLLNLGAGASTANSVADVAGLPQVGEVNVVTPGATLISLRAFTSDAALNDLGVYNPAMDVCATITFLGSGGTISECLIPAGTPTGSFHDGGDYTYDYLTDGDVEVTYTFDLNGNGILESTTDRAVTVLFENQVS